VSCCASLNACTSGDTCGSGVCGAGSRLACDDGNPCTTDTCDAVGGCQHVDNTLPCDDGNACTTADTCSDGTCVGANPVVCAAIDQCHTAGTCDAATGTCSSPALTCHDTDPCTVDTCDPAQGCVFTPATGFDSLTCLFTGGAFAPDVCAPVAPSITQQIQHAGGLITLAADSTDPKVTHKNLKKAAGSLKKTTALIKRLLKKRKLSPACASALRTSLGTASARIKSMMQGH